MTTHKAERSTIRIESESRWDALALARSLSGENWHLLQTGPDRWYVCLPGRVNVDGLSDDLLRLLRRWLDQRALPATVVHLPGEDRVVEREPGVPS
jgi:hypothetical protein